MSGSPTTRFSLVARLRDVRDAEAWAEFVELYAPLVYRLARRHGLQDADAADLTQDVLRAAVAALPRFAYDPGRGTFRGWLFTVARNRLRQLARARRRQPQTGGGAADEVLSRQPLPEEDAWEREYQERLFEWAAERVRGQLRPSTWQAFWRTAVEGQDVREVGAALGMSPGAVYIARTRALARLRAEVRRVEDEPLWEDGG
jgi:RNA polymerase sigma-70 factor (ECF subfamily)